MMQILIEYVYKYLGVAFNIGIGENGEIYVQTFKVNGSEEARQVEKKVNGQLTTD